MRFYLSLILCILFLTFGGVFFLYIAISRPTESVIASPVPYPTATQIPSASPTALPPQKIVIDTAHISASIVDGGIKDGDWILSDTAALYVPTSGKLGDGGNTIIYAHKRKSLFVTLSEVNIGDKITVYDQSGKQFVFTVYSKQDIKPTDIDKLFSNIPNNLTLFTCDGAFDSERLLVMAKID